MQSKKKKGNGGSFDGDPSEMRKAPGYTEAVPGVNTPNIEVPPYNPPVPNRAWTEMRKNLGIEALGEEEKRDLNIGKRDLM